MDIIPPIMNLQPIILKPSPSSCNPITLAIHKHTMPKATIIIPAVKNGLKSDFLSFSVIIYISHALCQLKDSYTILSI